MLNSLAFHRLFNLRSSAVQILLVLYLPYDSARLLEISFTPKILGVNS